MRLGISKKKEFDGGLSIEWSAVDSSFEDAEFHGVAASLAALFTPVYGRATKKKAALTTYTFPEAKGVQLVITGGISYETAQLTISLGPA